MHAQRITAVTALAAASALVLAGCAGGSAVPAADVTDEPEYSGTLSILTKFGGEPLGPYFEDLAAEYEELHPDVSFELIQETDQSVKDKTKTLTASGALPDIYFTWAGNWAQNFIDGGLAADLTEVIDPDTEWGKTFGEASLNAFEVDGKSTVSRCTTTANSWATTRRSSRNSASRRRRRSRSSSTLRTHQSRRLRAHRVWKQGRLAGVALPAAAVRLRRAERRAAGRLLARDREARGPGLPRLDEAVHHPGQRVHGQRQGLKRRPYTTAQQALAGAGRYVLPGDPRVRHSPRQHAQSGELRYIPLPCPTARRATPKPSKGRPRATSSTPSPGTRPSLRLHEVRDDAPNAAKLSAPPYGQPSAVKGAVSDETSTAP